MVTRRDERRHRIAIAIAIALAAVVAALWVAVFSSTARTPTSAGEPRTTPVQQEAGMDRPVLTVIGDSLTASGGPLDGDAFDEHTWIPHATGDAVTWAGGWAVKGATTSDMAASATPVPAATVLVILAGTNDTDRNVPFHEIAANLTQIADTVGAPRVIVSSIPPRADKPEIPTRFNDSLRAYADAKGWVFVDTMAGVRDGAAWLDGMSADGIHPTPEGYRVIGEALRAAILAA